MYTIHFYDMGGELHTEETEGRDIALALAKQAKGKVWVTDEEGEIIYEKEEETA